MKKFLLISCFFITTLSFAAPADVLHLADSLFAQKKYIQAMEKYEQLLYQERVASPAMLLRMAYIKEGLGQVDEALYYLNMYYLSTMDDKTLQRMEVIAEDNDLVGYDAGDFEYFIAYYYRYYEEVLLLFVAFTLFCFAVMIYRKRQGVRRPVVSGVFFILFIGTLFYLVNYGKAYEKGIISFQDTYVMSGPSAGAKVLDIITPGHRVEVLGREDVWTKIQWEGKTAYVKNKNIRSVNFL